jgi:carbon-monoxide dehydrogenase small subunit
MELELALNGEHVTLATDPTGSLLDVLRRHGYTGAKRGCDTGDCGFCTVLVDGDPVKSCVLPAVRADGATVETVEGLGTQDDLHPIQAAFVDEAALQCGFCIPGMIMRTKGLLAETPDPSEAAVRAALSGNLCRCTGYERIVDAVQEAARRLSARDEDRADVATDGGGSASSVSGCRGCDCGGVRE